MIALIKNKMQAPSRAPTTNYGFTSKNLEVAERGDTTDALIAGNKPLFEHLKGGDQQHKPYFDIDCPCDDYEGEQDFKSQERAVLDEAIGTLLQLYPDLDRKEHLCVSSYSGLETSHERTNKPVKKHGKHLISFHIVVNGRQCTQAENKAIAIRLKSVCPTFDTQVYSNNQLFRVAGHHKHTTRDAGCRSPKLLYFDGK